jgi:16S rRNA (guanine966-N2)-methyltransferase
MVRAAVFDALQWSVEGRRVLDLYAGSGACSFEALSRGAAHAVLVEQEPRLVARLHREAERLGLADRVTVERGDVRHRVRSRVSGRAEVAAFDLVFVDPPYDDVHDLEQVLRDLLASGLLGARATLVTQRPRVRGEPAPIDWPVGLRVVRSRDYGQATVDFLEPAGETPK